MKKLKVGVIGLGVGSRHAVAYKSHPQVQVVALCDRDKDKLRQVAAKYPEAKTTTDARAVITDKDVEAVSIASYDSYHAEQVVMALRAGKHVFVEKPLCLREKEARRIKQLLLTNPGLRLSSHFPLRQTPRFRELKRWLEAGRLGRVYYAEADYNYGRWEKIVSGWRGQSKNYSVVLGGGIHMVDLLLWLIGKKVTEVCAYGSNLVSREAGLAFNDCVISNLKFADGTLAKVACNFACVHPHYHAVSVYGAKATFINGRKKAEFFTNRAGEPRQINTAYRQDKQKESTPFIASFVESVVGKRKPAVTEQEVFDAMSVCFAIERSVATGRPMPVKYI